MDKIRRVAMMAVGRAVFFGGFAISLVMMGFAFDFSLALRAGAVLTLAMAALLLWFAQTAAARRPENSEVWLLLPAEDKPRSATARAMFAAVMAQVYLYYAVRAFAFAVAFLAASLALGLAGLDIGLS